MTIEKNTYIAFTGTTLITRGDLHSVVTQAKRRSDTKEKERIALYAEHNGAIFDVDFSGSLADVLARLPSQAKASPNTKQRGPGRPKLGVVCREVSLLPRHWAWLSTQRGGASASLRRLVDDARKNTSDKESIRHIIDAAPSFHMGYCRRSR